MGANVPLKRDKSETSACGCLSYQDGLSLSGFQLRLAAELMSRMPQRPDIAAPGAARGAERSLGPLDTTTITATLSPHSSHGS